MPAGSGADEGVHARRGAVADLGVDARIRAGGDVDEGRQRRPPARIDAYLGSLQVRRPPRAGHGRVPAERAGQRQRSKPRAVLCREHELGV
jgi:hypothetical protein